MKNIEDMKYYLVENEEKELTEGIAPRLLADYLDMT
jgi:hypothetical protein